MEITRPALKYYGGKWILADWIISFFPDHINYVEPCGGAASVLLRKSLSPLETYNDINGRVVNFFKVLRDQPEALVAKIKLTPWSRTEQRLARELSEDPIEDARRFFCVMLAKFFWRQKKFMEGICRLFAAGKIFRKRHGRH